VTVVTETTAGLLARLADFESRIAAAVAARRGSDDHADDPFRGLYLSDDAVEALLAGRRSPFPGVLAQATPTYLGDPDAGIRPQITKIAQGGRDADPLARVAASAGLGDLDLDLLLVALAPDVDSRFEQFYGYLNDDVTRRRATVGLALRLCGLPEASVAGRMRLDTAAPLVAAALLSIDETDRPFLSRTLRVPDRVVAHLLGDDRPDPLLAALVDVVAAEDAAYLVAGIDETPVDRFALALRNGVRLAHLRQRPGSGARELAMLAAGRAGFDVVSVDPVQLAAQTDIAHTHRALLREAVLRGAALVVGPFASVPSGSLDNEGGGGPSAAGDGGTEALVRALRHPAVPLLTFGPDSWDPRWSDEPPLQVEAIPLVPSARAGLWRTKLAGRLAEGVDPAVATAHFVLDPRQISRAARAAALYAMADGAAVDAVHMAAGARTQNASGLQRLARRIEPSVSWTDLVLPDQVLSLLQELTSRAQFRDRVLDEWRMRPGGGRGRGVAGLFAGDSGTGKTMSAEVVAASLGMDLYTVNLASVVSKYIGETEKNLERIFAEAAGTNGVLLFDEADAIFGKRSEVKDAHDRYANIESAYLLQRMETFDGIALLATNLRANLDEAFTRRLDVVVDFPMPDAPLRNRLWDRCLAPGLPRADDLDLEFLATRFELAGGHIRSAAVTSAYLAARAGRPVSMIDLVGAVAREYRKLGRLCLDSEFGHYLELIETVVV
jgi:hypothetical protein